MFSIRNIIGLAVLLMVIGAVALGWPTFSSYLRTGAGMAGDSVRSMVPTGFEVERLQVLVEDLDQTIAEQRARLVKQQVDLDYLRKEVTRADDRVNGLEREVVAARSLLAVDRSHYQIGGEQYSRRRVVHEAEGKAEALVRARQIAGAKSETLIALESALAKADEQIRAAERARETFAMRLAEVRADADHVALRQELVTTIGTLPGGVEAGAFQQVEEAFVRVERELEVQHRLLDEHVATGSVEGVGTIAFSESDSGDVLALLDRALGVPEADTDSEVEATVAHSISTDVH